MYYIVFLLSVSISLPDGRSGTKIILETPKLEHCINTGTQYIELLSTEEYMRQIESFKVECKVIERHDI